jgi:ligand-binding sensor domain-containing protein/signal transduction histidine kinase
MTQTRDGYLWLGTVKGLVRFDGYQFTLFDENNTPGLNSSRIVCLFEDSRSNLWVGTESAGVALIKDGRVISLDLGRGSREGRLMAACEDGNGAVWLYTANGQLGRYRRGRVDVWDIGVDRPSFCRAMVAENSGVLWLGTDWHLFGLNPKVDLGPTALPLEQAGLVPNRLEALLGSANGGLWRLANGRVQKWMTNRFERDFGAYPWNARVSAACEDRQGNLVVGTLGDGVWWFDAQGKAFQVPIGPQGLSHSYILSLAMDREGSLWVGTDGGGLDNVKAQPFGLLETTGDLNVHSVCEDHEGGLWFGSYGGAYHLKGNDLKKFGPEQGLANVNDQAVFVDTNEMVWVGTFNSGLFQFQNGKFAKAQGTASLNQDISALHQDRNGVLWVGTQGGLARRDGTNWKVFTTRDGLSDIAVQAIADDTEGNLWIGTDGGGLVQLREEHGKTLFTSFHNTNGVSNKHVSSLLVDGEGILWIGTDGGGLTRLQAGKWTQYTTRDGLLSDSIGYLLEDGEGYLWMGSNAGLLRVPKKALNDFAQGATNSIPCRAYEKSDGLPTRECSEGSQPAACRTRDGKLWFPTIKGLVFLEPGQLVPNTNPPPVIIESVLVDGQEQNTNILRGRLREEVTIPPGTESLEIRYTSLNLANAAKTRFKHRMEGYETAWKETSRAKASESPTARYIKLPPDRYRFHVMACNEDGVWNETGAAVTFNVLPPFWRTWWFLAVSTACLLGMVVAMVHYFSTQKLQRQLEGLRQQQALEKERQRIARDIHDQLGANLTQVSLLGELVESDKDSPTEVEAHARQISQTARDTSRVLDEIVWAVNPSNDTLDGLITYFCKNAQEYLEVAGLSYRLDVPSQLPATPIPPEVRHNVFLAAKEAVTNIVRHAGASAVWIRLRLEPDRFVLEIEDNGRGLAGLDEKKARSRNGLTNMRKRLEEIGGRFTASTGSQGGALIQLTGPLRPDKIDGNGAAG